MSLLLCLAIALHDVDGPIHCATGEKIRLQGIGALEMDGCARPGQPSVAGDPWAQRRVMVDVIGATTAAEDSSHLGQAWFVKPVELRCETAGKSHKRVTAWCARPDGADLSCGAIRAGVALRWARYDRPGRLLGCERRGGKGNER